MDPIKNPFSPGAGSPPPELVGRYPILEQARILLGRVNGALSAADVAKALQDPAKAAGVSFNSSALDEVYRQTKGYPYFVQEWGYQAWNLAASSPIRAAPALRAVRYLTEGSLVFNDYPNWFRVCARAAPQSPRRLSAV